MYIYNVITTRQEQKQKLIKLKKGNEKMKRRFTVSKKDLPAALDEISKRQTKSKTFYNVSVKPYKGQKHPNESELFTVTIG